MSDVQGPQRYMVGDVIRVELDLEHQTNLGRVFVAFTNQTDPLTEFYFETTPLPEERQAGVLKTSRIVLEAPVPPETIPGVYTLNRVMFSPSEVSSPGCARKSCRRYPEEASRSSRSRQRRLSSPA